jgi:signal transduction histidine kinase
LKLLRTTSFRWALIYLVLFILSVAALLGYIYWNTAVLIGHQTDATIEAEITGLAEQYAQGGLSRLVRTIERRSRKDGESVYLLTDSNRRPLAGNLERFPGNASYGPGWIEFPYIVPTGKGLEPHAARARLFRMKGGFYLLVGRDIYQIRRFQSLMQRALLSALALALALGLGGGYLMSRNMLARIETINHTAGAIIGGNLGQRIPLSGSGDEIDQLAANLNAMLARIETLMTGLREVTDNVAHDLRTPLARLRARLEDVQRNARMPETARDTLDAAIADASQLITTFNTLLGIARAESGSGRDLMAEEDLAALLENLAELYQPMAEENGIVLTTALARGITAPINRQLVTQAIANLLDNAIKYAPTGDNDQPVITLELIEKKGRARIVIADNGPGIAPEDRKRVLERFVRLDNSRSRPGSGLGLSLAAAAARFHKGRILLEDNRPGLRAIMEIPVRNKGTNMNDI